MKNFIQIHKFSGLALVLFFLTVLTGNNVHSKQHIVIENVLKNIPSCRPNVYFSDKEINSSKCYSIYTNKCKSLIPSKEIIRTDLVKDLNLMPVDFCVLRGNKNYHNDSNEELLKKLKVHTIVNTDMFSHKMNKTDASFNYKYLPMTSNKYPGSQDIDSIIQALDILSHSSPSKKAFVSCFFGKHRTGLIIALYQFLHSYAEEPKLACANIGSNDDKSYTQMNTIAAKGVLTYDMPSTFKAFYIDFAQSVCKKDSYEFLKSKGAKVKI